MNVRDLFHFEVLAEEGHLGRAAERVGRTKPALTKCVDRLEAEIGAPLFQRIGRRICLTPPGQALLTHARQVRSTLDDAVREVSDMAAGRAGHIRLGMGTTIHEYFMPRLTEWFLSESASLTIEIHLGLSDTLRQGLSDGKLDGIITTALPDDGQRFMKHDWLSDQVVVIARKEHPLTGRQFGIQDLTGFSWVLPGRGVISRQWLDGAFIARGLLPPRVRAEVSSVQLLPSFIRGSDLLSFTPRVNLAAAGIANDLVELSLPETTMPRTLSFLHRRNIYMPPAMERLAASLKEIGATMTVPG